MRLLLWIVLAATGVLVGGGRGAVPPAGTPASVLPALKVEKDAPLLLETPAPAPPGSATPAAQPWLAPPLICYDCHGNYREEALAVAHAKKGITCVECHGESEAHASDEDNTTAPQVLYSRDRIGKKCAECHKTHDVRAALVVGRCQERGLSKMGPQTLVCTDCHGLHRLRVRTIHWDKRTGLLLPAGGHIEK